MIRRTVYIISYNFPLNTRRGFRTIYYLMRLSQHDMTTVIKDIIAVRHTGINFIRNVCDKLEKEDDYISCNTFYGGARVVILYNLSSAKCSNTAYGAKPSRTSIECSIQVDDLFIY